ncbi:SET domain-containing protein [Parendozoicomonas haliclonae]
MVLVSPAYGAITLEKLKVNTLRSLTKETSYLIPADIPLKLLTQLSPESRALNMFGNYMRLCNRRLGDLKLWITPLSEPNGFRIKFKTASVAFLSPLSVGFLRQLEDLQLTHIDIYPIKVSPKTIRPVIALRTRQKNYFIKIDRDFLFDSQPNDEHILLSSVLYSWVDHEAMMFIFMAIKELNSQILTDTPESSSELDDKTLILKCRSRKNSFYQYVPYQRQYMDRLFTSQPAHYFALYTSRSELPGADKGLFSLDNIPAGKTVALVSGQITSSKRKHRLLGRHSVFITSTNESGKSSITTITPPEELACRWINKACNIEDEALSPEPNITMRTLGTLDGKIPVTQLVSLKPIPAHQELLFSYDSLLDPKPPIPVESTSTVGITPKAPILPPLQSVPVISK